MPVKKVFNATVSIKDGVGSNVLRGIVQHDTLNEVNIRLSNDSKAFNYTGYTNIVFKVLKADGTSYIDSEGEFVIATSPEHGIVTVILKGQATAAAGICQSVIEIYVGKDKLTTARLNYEVLASLGVDETAVSEDQYPVFQKLLGDLSALEASIEAAETARAAAEADRASSATGYVARAEQAAETAEMWAKASQNVAEGDFATRAELDAVRVGAAPAGYGLGEFGRILTGADNIDTVKTNGWYLWNVNDKPRGAYPTPSNDYMSLLRVWGNTAVCHQELVDMTNSGDHGAVCWRTIYGNVVFPWEWVNPPMFAGYEYRTTERFMGKSVYTKLIDFGSNTNGRSVVVAYDVYQVIRCEAQGGGSATYPWIQFQGNEGWECFFSAARAQITDSADEHYGEYACVVNCYTGKSASNSYSTNFVRVWYTKITD